MPDSNITKRALAASLKSLMSDSCYKKISVADICDKCGMNRKSFYYHFRDKYDLVNWIFDFEFCRNIRNSSGITLSDAFVKLCDYFYLNRDFYREAFRIEGQNSFSQHFNELCYGYICDQVKDNAVDKAEQKRQAVLLSEITLSVIKLWLFEKNCRTPQQLASDFKNTIVSIMHSL